MAPITVGSTRVSLTPDLTRFGPILRSELPPVVERIGGDLGKTMGDAMSRRLAAAMPDAMRDAGRLMTPVAAKAGVDAGDAFATGFETKLAARLAKFRPAVTVDIKLDDAKARAQLDKLAADRTVSLTPELDDAKAKSALDRLTADRTVKVAVRFDDAKAKASLAALGKGKPVRIRADLDDAAAVAKLTALTRPRATPIIAVVATAQAEADLTAILAPRHIAVTPVLEAPSTSAISEYASGVQSALSKAGGLVLGAPTISTELGQQVASYIATISEPIQVPIEPRISLLRRMLINRWRNQVGEDIQIAVSPELAAAGVLTVRTELTDLGRQVTVSVAADWDTTAAGIVQAHILALQSPVQVPIQPIFDSSATPVVAAHLQRLKETIEVIIKPIWDSAAAAIVEAHIERFKEPVEVPIKPVWDSAAAAAVRAQLARLASPTTAPISPTLLTGSLLAAGFLLDRLARRRTAQIGVRVDQNSIRTLGLLGSSGQSASAGLGSLVGSTHLLAGAVASALPMLASLGSALAQLAPAAALAAPALVMLGASFAAIKIGTSGVGEAFKAAFAPATDGARQATAAARQTENAQRSLASAQRSVADAQRSLKDAQVAASEQIQQAQRRVSDAERDLSQAQRDAATAQRDLTSARRQAVRDLEDMNARLKGAELDQRAATLAVQQAEEDLARTRSDPSATQLQIQQAELSAERARQSVEDQRRDLKRMQSETAAANRAGVEGSKGVVQAKQQIARADQDIADRQRALRDSQEDVTKAQVQGQRRVTDAQRAVADAQRSVADAARNLADVQQSAASATDKFADAMAKLSPNARDFVNQVKAMAPAWDGLKLGVQDALFDGLGKRLTSVGRQVLPTLKTGLAGTATQLNLMGRGALTAVSNLQKAGTLRGVFDTVRSGLSDLKDIPGQVVTGLGQLTVAAQPAFERVTTGAASAVDRVMQSLTAGMESGRLTESINTALNVAVSFGKVLADAFGIVKNVMSTAADAGGDFFAVVGSALAEIRRVTALPEVQAALKSIFSALQAVASLLATTLGAALQAVLPLLAALAPAVTALAKAFGPVVKQLAGALGTALMPIIKALAPVLDTVVAVIVQLAKQLAGPLGTVINALIPGVQLFGKLFADVFKALLPALKPLLDIVGKLAGVLAGVFAQVLKALVPALMPLIPVIVLVVKIFGELLGAILKPLMPVISSLAKMIGEILVVAVKALAPIIKMVADIFKELLPVFRPLFPVIGELVGALAQLLKPLLQLVMLALKPLLAVIGFVARLLVGALGAALKFLVPIVVTVLGWVAKLATFITKAVTAIVKAFAWLFDKLLGHSIIPDIVNGAIKWFKGLWHKAVDIFTTIKNKVKEIWDKLWGGIKSAASAAWGAVRKGFDKFADGFKSAFSKVKSAIGKIWDGLKALVKAPIKFWIEVVYNRGIVNVWNKTAAKIPGVPDLKTMTLPKGFRRGGILPGFSRWWQGDDQVVPMRRGEGVYVSEAMRDPYERARLHAVNAAAMRGQSLKAFRGFAEGGILGDLGSTVGKVLGKGADIVRGGIADLAEAAFTPVKDAIGGMTGAKSRGSWPSMIAKAPLNIISKAIDFIRGKEEATIGRGRWLRPVNAPYGTKFGVKGHMWSSGRHTGLDFPAKTGTPVKAVAAGRVISAVSGGPFGPYGMNVQIRHGGDFSSLYAHMSAVLVKAKEAVTAGQRIGKVGATGNVTGPHLHLEARMGGKPIDPMPYLEGGGPGGGGKGVARWRSTVVTALNEVNQSVSLVSTVLRRMNQESGGNPTAVNRYDSNWRAGHPSVGLMQVIRGTFNAYAGRYRDRGPFLYGVSTNPLANIYASMRYALARYGSLPRAYNRPGGYAKGGTARPGELAWVGEQGPELMRVLDDGVRIFPHEQSKRMASKMGTPVPGYAKGGKITVGGKRIDTGPIRASVGGDFLKALAGTSAAISSAMTKVATALKNAFKGVKTTLDDRLIKSVNSYSKKLQSLAGQRDKIRAQISQATTMATEQTDAARSFTQMTSLPSSGLPFGAGGIAAGLKVRLGQLKAFGANLGTLGKRGLSKELLQQIIAAGPDSGAPYAAALVKATDAELRDINATQKRISSASKSFGRSAADAMFDSGKMAGKGFLTGLKAQDASIVKQMSALARAIQSALKEALKMRSPSLIMRGLGSLTMRSFRMGIVDQVRPVASAAGHAAASTAARMAAVVRSATAAGAARVENNTSSRVTGDRILNYNALTREVASRQSIHAAFALDDLLHQPVVAGG